jgi:FMN phosphatase YigB (HAD superfamily)
MRTPLKTASKLASAGGVLLDVDGTMYRQPPLRARMLLEILKYTLRHPLQGSKMAYILREFRANRDSLRGAPTYKGFLEEIQYVQVAGKMKVPVTLIKEIVEEWIMTRPLRFLSTFRRPGIEVFLQRCRDHGMQIGAFSDYPTRRKVEALGLSPWFNLHLCSTDPDINRFKPSPEGILLACKTWKLVPEELLYVGDQVKIDGAAAEAAGSRFVLVGQSQDCRHFAVRDFFELASHL